MIEPANPPQYDKWAALTSTAVEPTQAQCDDLRFWAGARGCPASVASILDRIAAGRYVSLRDVYWVTRTHGDAANFYVRLRASGLDITGFPEEHGAAHPAELALVRRSLMQAARAYAGAMDAAAEAVAAAEHEYARELGWFPR